MLKEKFSTDKIFIFDADDTLVITDAKIRVCDEAGKSCFELSPEEFNSYQHDPKHILNFDDFKSLEIMKAGKLIQKYLDVLAREYKKGNAIGVITARDDQDMIYTWLKEHVGFHVKKEFIWAINDPKLGLTGNIAKRKKDAFQWFIDQGYTDLTFFDDDKANIKIIKDLAKENKTLRIKTHLAKK
tara:strand:+ start:2967 stop:3521 length:555 start_codon:yes stop_codon:yes gene_type:complete